MFQGQGPWTVLTLLIGVLVINKLNKENGIKTDEIRKFQRDQAAEQRKHFDSYKKESIQREEDLKSMNKTLMTELSGLTSTQERLATSQEQLSASQEQIAGTMEKLNNSVEELKKEHVSLKKEVSKIKEETQIC